MVEWWDLKHGGSCGGGAAAGGDGGGDGTTTLKFEPVPCTL